MDRFTFPKWTNRIVPLAALLLAAGSTYTLVIGAYATAPTTTNVGYSPAQPVPFSHKVHVGQLKMDCRYCHSTVDQAAHAAVPATQTCINCHSAANPDGSVANSAVHTQSAKLLAVRESQATGDPIEWQRVHDLPDYVYFDHSVHVNRGVSCVSCHGRVDKMDQVYQAMPLTMSWCLDCHRNPEPHLRPQEYITQLDWEPE
ncbi:MAG: cytochrome c3 family protein, partial [Planctomycetota bacterium]